EGNLLSGNLGTGLSFFDDAHDNLMQGNLVGTDRTGLAGLGNRFSGIAVNLSPRNTIGGTAAGARNTISGNGFSGVVLYQAGATGNVLQGNFIGTDAAGTHKVPNRAGVVLDAASGALVGGADAAARNLISGNDQSAIYLTGAAAASNRIEGNFIGTDVTGNVALGNGATLGSFAIDISGQFGVPPGTLVVRNVISGNGGPGVGIHMGADGNTLSGNFIGTNAAGTAAVSNRMGIALETANNVVGG